MSLRSLLCAALLLIAFCGTAQAESTPSASQDLIPQTEMHQLIQKGLAQFKQRLVTLTAIKNSKPLIDLSKPEPTSNDDYFGPTLRVDNPLTEDQQIWVGIKAPLS
ncbi:hypothetical protein [Dongshaea marina]|uniref:hypothetical protein n=1 Tax=Dongshaea marina TaxID=2047966 RepID=UPI000D3E25E7|nr:hypothetical protein [Dongshaea marina]